MQRPVAGSCWTSPNTSGYQGRVRDDRIARRAARLPMSPDLSVVPPQSRRDDRLNGIGILGPNKRVKKP